MGMIKRKRIIIVFLILMLSIFVFPKKVLAADSGIFSVKPIFPDNQISRQNAYYLLVKPGQKQIISFYISNLQDKPQTFKVEPGMYINNSQGEMALTTDKKLIDPSLPANMLEMGVKPTLVTVPANQNLQVNQEYQIPDKNFKGIIYGGIRVTSGLQNSSEVKTKKQKGVRTLVNTYGQIDTGVIMTMDKNYPKSNLLVKNVGPVPAAPYPVFSVKVQNPYGTIIDSLNLKVKIKKDGINIKNTKYSKVSLSQDYYGYSVAPYSNFNLALSIGKNRIIPGNYTLELTGRSHGQEFKQNYKFIVNKNDAKKINKDNSEVNPDYTFLYFVIIVIAVISLVGFVIFMYFFGMNKVLHTPGKSEKSSSDQVQEPILKKQRYGQSNVPKRRSKK